MKIFTVILFCAFPVFAAKLECLVLINLDVVTKSTISTSLMSKVPIVNHQEIISYVTETSPDTFSLEAFVPSLDARIYSEASMSKTEEKISAVLWSREILAEVVCKKLNI